MATRNPDDLSPWAAEIEAALAASQAAKAARRGGRSEPKPEPVRTCGDRRGTWVCNRDAGHQTDDSGALDKPLAHMYRNTDPDGVRVRAEWFDG